jgi:uncharacterized SAM-binding protein YcdF (DUF218 family)
MHLIHRQEVWIPTVQGGLVILACLAAFMLFLLARIYSFLALNRPIKADVLVIEGWMKEYAIKDAIAEFRRGGYQKLIAIGPSLSEGYYLVQYKNFAERAAAMLIALGFDPDKVVAVPTPDVFKHRTYSSALALREWIAESDLKVESINLYTFDVHSRRSWLLFKHAFAPEIKVGVIPLEPLNYDPKRWWTSSTGVKSIIFETIAYIYVRFVSWKA